ncbi:MAG: sigma-54-dependent Fis family transcriptional regulator [Gammaproteobacteria bacterium]|nr:sigma-54-dependent Fis family transcriptional regulator [Gammaproteobacteria bacterium]
MSPIRKVLIVDDEPDICELLEITLGRMGLQTHAVQTFQAAIQQLKTESYDLCLTDMRLPDGDGLNVIAHIQQHCPNTPVAMITAHGNMEAAIKALKLGAFDFVSKPVDLKNLREMVSSALKLSSNTNKTLSVKTNANTQLLLGESPIMHALRGLIAKLARSQAPVFIYGESGTGKERVARLIHAQGPRADKPFVAVNCGAIPTELMESEFFGHAKGSFTGAVADKEGLFLSAQGGTLFLDEIAELPAHMQVKLLRAIQEKAIRPVGSNREQHVDVRILSATHQDLRQRVEQQQFRQDLYYRLNVIQVDVPALRDRVSDIPLLAKHLLDTIAHEYGATNVQLEDSAIALLQDYPFPGNVRELENILERAVALSEHSLLTAADINLPDEALASNYPSTKDHPNLGYDTDNDANLDHQLADQERESILQALEQTRWNKTRAAEVLGLSFRQLRYRIKKLGLE